RVHDAGRVVQFHGDRHQVTDASFPQKRESSDFAQRHWVPASAGTANVASASMLHYFIKRLLGLAPTLLIVGILVFLLVHLLPGDPARLAAGPDATPETVQLVRRDLGLDLPLPQQFIRFVSGVLHGDLGRSIRTKRAVASEIADRFSATMWLTVWAMAWSV